MGCDLAPSMSHTQGRGLGSSTRHWGSFLSPQPGFHAGRKLPLEEFAALEKSPGLVPSTGTGTYKYPQRQLQEICYPLLASTGTRHTCGHMCRQNFTCNVT